MANIVTLDSAKTEKGYLEYNKFYFINRSKITLQNWLAAWILAESKFTPNLLFLTDIYDMTMLDLHLLGSWSRRKNKVLGESFEVRVGSRVDDTLTSFFETKWFQDFVHLALNAKMYPLSLIEIQPLVNGKIEQIKLIERRNCVPQKNAVTTYPGTMDYMYYDGKTEGINPDYYVDARPDIDFPLGMLLPLVPSVIYKRGSIADWSRFARDFGFPTFVAKTDTKDQQQKSLVEGQMKSFRETLMMIIGLDDDFDSINPASGSGVSDVFERLGTFSNAEISDFVEGIRKDEDSAGSLKTYVNKDALSMTPAEELKEADMTMIENLVNYQLIPKMRNLGYPMPTKSRFAYSFLEAKRMEGKSSIIKPTTEQTQFFGMLFQNGYKVTPKYIEETFGIPVEMQETELVQPQLTEAENNLDKVENRFVNDYISAYYDKYSCKTCLGQIENKINPKQSISVIALDIIAKIWAGSFDALYSSDLMGAYVLGFEELINQGFTQTNPEFVAIMQANCNEFAKYKSYQFVAKLKKIAEKAENKADYDSQAKALNDLFNGDYLQVENNHVLASSIEANFWQENVTEDTILQYDTVGDGRVRPEHIQLDGITRKASDKFWDVYYPPNGYRCRCTTRIVLNGTITKNAKLPTIPIEFRNNTGKTGIIWNTSHPYFKVSKAVKAQLF